MHNELNGLLLHLCMYTDIIVLHVYSVKLWLRSLRLKHVLTSCWNESHEPHKHDVVTCLEEFEVCDDTVENMP